MMRKTTKKTSCSESSVKRKRRTIANCNCDDLNEYVRQILKKEVRVSKEIRQQYQIIVKEFRTGEIEVDLDLYQKYIQIGFLFFKEIFLWQKASTALFLCTFYKGTKRPRWNKVMFVIGRGNGKDGMIAWWSTCLTSTHHGIKQYDIDIIANNMEQSLRPILDIDTMIEDRNLKKSMKKVGDSILCYKTRSSINARSSDASMQDGLRSGAVIFNEIHIFEDYSKLNVMITGLGKIEDPRTLYFTTNGEVRGGVLDDMLDTAKDVLDEVTEDKRTLYFIYKLNEKKEVHDPENWVMANPSLPYRETLYDEIVDEYDKWKHNPGILPAFLQKRMNLPEIPTDQEVVPWETILKTKQKIDLKKLTGRSCILGIDLSKTTDWTAVNLLFYDEETEKYICINHAFICGQNKDLQGIKAPYEKWCSDGFGTILDEKEVDPRVVLRTVFGWAEQYQWNIEAIVIDDFKKEVMKEACEEFGYSKEDGNLFIIKPSNIAAIIPSIERAFINEQLVWGDNPMLRWATNNTKVVSWKPRKTTGDAEMGNQLYGKINPRFRKTDPFMAFVHSFIKVEILKESTSYDLDFVGF